MLGTRILGHAVALLLCLGTTTSALPQSSIRDAPLQRTEPCRFLAAAGLGSQLFFQGDDEYTATLQSYYSGESREITPQCILKPETARQVSVAIRTLNSDKAGRCWNVAIRAGGHSNFVASNTASGVTIDLEKLNAVKINEDGTVSVGTGNRWGDVYRYLEPRGLMVAGGRENTVGIGGLLLGGGFSWFSGSVGFAADNVAAYEVVLANGSIITATASENADLFRALKGGACNFGLVTTFVLRSFPARDLFGGVMVFSYAQADTMMRAFVDMIDGNMNGHPDDTGFASAGWDRVGGRRVAFIAANLEGRANTTAFAGLEPIVDLRAKLPVTGIAAQIADGTDGEHQIWTTLTYANTMDMGRKVLASFEALVSDLEAEFDAKDEDGDVRIIYLISPFPTLFSSHGGGGNVMGLVERHTRNAVVFSLQALLPTAKYRDMLRRKADEATLGIEAYAKETEQDIHYRYLNYAGPGQNPLARYGEENVRFMKEVAARYDPGEFFQYGVPGGFKLKDV
ncbi:FAD binding domain-containing protein [Colletotrichum musicola]|uniref:FAD binding domain-containing protein n=1 Tax=Colletotrichum musicola TaxID=2175873 RepID=A0A8H6KLL0_9PEZI|nr:FAD binding domain-containing protein [Colletotrichum musicola]